MCQLNVVVDWDLIHDLKVSQGGLHETARAARADYMRLEVVRLIGCVATSIARHNIASTSQHRKHVTTSSQARHNIASTSNQKTRRNIASNNIFNIFDIFVLFNIFDLFNISTFSIFQRVVGISTFSSQHRKDVTTSKPRVQSRLSTPFGRQSARHHA